MINFSNTIGSINGFIKVVTILYKKSRMNFGSNRDKTAKELRKEERVYDDALQVLTDNGVIAGINR